VAIDGTHTGMVRTPGGFWQSKIASAPQPLAE
jgi:hypothetical protein